MDLFPLVAVLFHWSFFYNCILWLIYIKKIINPVLFKFDLTNYQLKLINTVNEFATSGEFQVCCRIGKVAFFPSDSSALYNHNYFNSCHSTISNFLLHAWDLFTQVSNYLNFKSFCHMRQRVGVPFVQSVKVKVKFSSFFFRLKYKSYKMSPMCRFI